LKLKIYKIKIDKSIAHTILISLSEGKQIYAINEVIIGCKFTIGSLA
jgi:hypothetical protein